jgi:nicotinate phosphoribosyltransferase
MLEGDGLKTDLYQLTMIAASYYMRSRHKNRATCEAFVRKLPGCRKFLVMAGTEQIREYLSNLRFTKDDVKFLKKHKELKSLMSVGNFDKYLEDFRFSGDLWAMAEGEIVFAGEPLVRVTGTLPEVHMAETYILSVLNHSVHIASKAARMVLAARGVPLLEFGTRRTHHEAALDSARAAYLAGFSATSNMRASQRYGIPNAGTMSHMWVMLNDDEEKAFAEFAQAFRNPTLLIDTYDTIEGAKKASKIKGLGAVRLDSGDFDSLSRKVREILDDSGHQAAKIVVSGDMNEYKIDKLIRDGAPIDMFGVGTELVTPKDIHSLGAVYKAVYDDTKDEPVIKVATGKTTMPGTKQVYLVQEKDRWSHLIALEGQVYIDRHHEMTPLLDCLIQDGKVCDDNIVDLEVSRKYCNAALINLPPYLATLSDMPTPVPVRPHDSVTQLFKKAFESIGVKSNDGTDMG